MLVAHSEHAPWCVLLSARLPIHGGWKLEHMLQLRAVCSGLRGGVGTGEFCAALLHELGVHHAPDLSARNTFALCRLVWAERWFTHTASVMARRMAGLRPGDTPNCVIAGSHAVHRMLRDDPEGFPAVDWHSRDVDIFVSGCRAEWTMAERAAHAELQQNFNLGLSELPLPLSAHGKVTNGAVEAVVVLGMSYLNVLYPQCKITREDREGYVGWSTAWTPDAQHDSASYSRAELVSALEQRLAAATDSLRRYGDWFAESPEERQAWLSALESQLPARGGPMNARPHRLGKIIELEVVRREGELFTPELRAHALGWWSPRRINVIELVSEAALPPLSIVGGFDMLQCGVAMLPAGPSGVHFVHSDATLECVRQREVRFSNLVLGPLSTEVNHTGHMDSYSRPQGLVAIGMGAINRALKYTERGFSLVNLHSGARLQSPQHPRARIFDASLRTLPALDRLLADAMDTPRTRTRPLAQLVKLFAPLVRRPSAAARRSPLLACITAAELAASIDRLLTFGLLVAWRLPAGVARQSPQDGFPLLVCTSPRAHRYEVGESGRLDAEQRLIATTHDFMHPVPVNTLPPQMEALPDLVAALLPP